MKQALYILLISVLMTSCASIIYIVVNNDTIKTINNKANLTVKRKKEELRITAYTDSLSKNLRIKPKNSSAYWDNILLYGIGMLIDMNNPKRYSYPQKIYINSADTINRYFRYGQVNNKGELYLHLSLPHINSFSLVPENEPRKTNIGCWGLTIGLDYYHAKNQFVNLGISGVSDFFVPFPAAVDISGEYELMYSSYISLSNNHKFKRFSLGYGIAYGKNIWDLRYYNQFNPPPPTRDPIKKSSNALGLIFPTYFQLGERFNMGIVYRPTFYRPDTTNKFKYEHLISIDFAWKIRLKR